MSVGTECPIEIVAIAGKGLGVRTAAPIAEGTIVRVPPENIRRMPSKERGGPDVIPEVACYAIGDILPATDRVLHFIFRINEGEHAGVMWYEHGDDLYLEFLRDHQSNEELQTYYGEGYIRENYSGPRGSAVAEFKRKCEEHGLRLVPGIARAEGSTTGVGESEPINTAACQ